MSLRSWCVRQPTRGRPKQRVTHPCRVAAGGHPMFSQKLYEQRGAYWPERQYEPGARSSGGQDTRGPCIGNFDKKKMLARRRHPQPAGGPETRIGFQFLTRANSTWSSNTRARASATDRSTSSLSGAPSSARSRAAAHASSVGEWPAPARAHPAAARRGCAPGSRCGMVVGSARSTSTSSRTRTTTAEQGGAAETADEKVTPHRPRSTTVRPSAQGSHGRSRGHATAAGDVRALAVCGTGGASAFRGDGDGVPAVHRRGRARCSPKPRSSTWASATARLDAHARRARCRVDRLRASTPSASAAVGVARPSARRQCTPSGRGGRRRIRLETLR